ncbi:MAG: translation initiation factor IF-2 [Bacteroidales bacterium]
MPANKAVRLSKLAREFNVGISTIIDFLGKKGINIDANPNAKVSPEVYEILMKEYSSEKSAKAESEKLNLRNLRSSKGESVSITDIEEIEEEPEPEEADSDDELIIKDTSLTRQVKEEPEEKPSAGQPKVLGKIDLDDLTKKKKKVELEKIEDKKEQEVKEIKEEKEEEKEEVKPPVANQKENTKVEIPELPEEEPEITEITDPDKELKVLGKIDLASLNQKTRPAKKTQAEKEAERKKKQKAEKEKETKEVESTSEKEVEEIKEAPKEEERKEEETKEVKLEKKKEEENFIRSKVQKLTGPTVVGKIDLPEKQEKKKPVASSSDKTADRGKKKKRRRIKVDKVDVDDKKKETVTEDTSRKKDKKKRKARRPEISEEDIQKQVKETLARLTTKGKSKGSKYRREKRDAINQKYKEEQEKIQAEKNVLKVTEFVSVNELASMMSVPVTNIIQTCMSLGLMVSINQRLDAETMALVADEFNYKVEFVSADLQEEIEEEEDSLEDMHHRPPIVTVMGHVDHGKTKLLDYVRHANVIAGEAGGITQHIGAYGVELDDGRQITFLDTPGHEAFTAMRARGAQITDVAIIVVAADDGVMPQTVEAINHAHAAGVPIVFAINKIDKPTANPEKIKEELANMNFLVEDWGGKYQSQEISAKSGINIEELLEKVLLEAELLELKANPNKRANGVVIESTLDRGRGYVATLLVESGTLKHGDVILAGTHYGHVKAMFNERGHKVEDAGPAHPVQILGLNGAPQAGDRFNVMENDREAKEIANKREQLLREQGLRTQKHITLDEIGRRIAIGNFQELNIIVKGDVDGSIEALSDSLIKLSTNEIQVNVIHKAVGAITETDVMLAAASNAIIVGFQVRPSMGARRLAEKEEIDIRLYSIIYDAINEIKDAMEGMLSPDIKEEIVATLEVRDVFKITKVGTIAGCMVKEGKIHRNTKVRIIRDGIVIYTGELGSLKRFKDDVKEVQSGYECGLNVANFNDIKVGDIIEGYKEVEVKKKL